MIFTKLSIKHFLHAIIAIAAFICSGSMLIHAGDAPGSAKKQDRAIYIHSLQIEHLLNRSYEEKGVFSNFFKNTLDIETEWKKIFNNFNTILSGYEKSNPSIWKKRFVDFDYLSYGYDSVVETIYRKLDELSYKVSVALKSHRKKIIEYCGLGLFKGKGVKIYSATMWHQIDNEHPGSSKKSDFIKSLDTCAVEHAISLNDQTSVFNTVCYMIAQQYCKQLFIDRCLLSSKDFQVKPAFVIKLENIEDQDKVKPFNVSDVKSIEYMDIEHSYNVKPLMDLYNRIKNYTEKKAEQDDEDSGKAPLRKEYFDDDECPHMAFGYMAGFQCNCSPEKIKADRLAEKRAKEQRKKKLDRLAKTYGDHSCEFNHAEVPLFDPVFLGCEYGLFSTGHICDGHKHKKKKNHTVQPDSAANIRSKLNLKAFVGNLSKSNIAQLITKLPSLVKKNKKLVMFLMGTIIASYIGMQQFDSLEEDSLDSTESQNNDQVTQIDEIVIPITQGDEIVIPEESESDDVTSMLQESSEADINVKASSYWQVAVDYFLGVWNNIDLCDELSGGFCSEEQLSKMFVSLTKEEQQEMGQKIINAILPSVSKLFGSGEQMTDASASLNLKKQDFVEVFSASGQSPIRIKAY